MASKERQARWRARARAAGKPLKRYDKPRVSSFHTYEFVAVDGEGFNEGPDETIRIGKDGVYKTTRYHHYAYLAASDGSEEYAETGRISSKKCLDFLLAIKQNNPNALPVVFSGSYDVCHMLAFGLEQDEIKHLLHGDPDDPVPEEFRRKILDVSLIEKGEGHDYRIEYRPRKSLSIWRWPYGADKFEEKRKCDGSTKWQYSANDHVVLWDVWGFFQGSFAQAMENWLPGHPDAEFIKTMKAGRSVFSRSEIDTIKHYNQLELKCLVEIMERLRTAIATMGLTITRWDGSGAISGAMLKHHNIKNYMATCPDEVFEAATIGYSGGHIEAYMLGTAHQSVFHDDINSAYPAEFLNLPSLADGTWQLDGTGDPPAGFTIVCVEFHYRYGMPFYPLFYRTDGGSIIYPQRGAGWYWYPEFVAGRDFARKFGAQVFRVVKWHHFKEDDPTLRPFAFIADLYEQRKAIIAQTRATGVPNGAQHTYKLAYNGGYGKTVQQVGARVDWAAREIIPPAYFQLEWGGYITAGARAKLMQAAMQKPHAIIAVATDGIYSLERLDLDRPAGKILGAWEETVHQGMTLVMPGVYWLHDEPSKTNKTGLTNYSRGFSKEAMETPEAVHTAWKRKYEEMYVASDRMVTLGTACISDGFFALRGRFLKSDRNLVLNGRNSKRVGISMHNKKPHLRMYPTQPIPTEIFGLDDADGEFTMSAPYPISWFEIDDLPVSQAERDPNAEAEKSFDDDAEAFFLR